MKAVVVIVLLAIAALVALSVYRSLFSIERAVLGATVIAFAPAPGRDSRNVHLPGEIKVKLSDGRVVTLQSTGELEFKPGTQIRVSERVAPWGEVWYRLVDP